MPFRTPTNIEAVVQDVVLNSPLVQRKLLKHGKDASEQQDTEQERQRKKGLRKLLSGMVSSFRQVISGVMPSPTSAVVRVTTETPIPLVDFVANRGLSSLPIVKNTRSGGHNNGYAKLAISLESNSGEDSLATSAGKHWKKTNRKGVEEMVEMCEKSTETTPSLLDYDSNDDNFYLEDFDGYYDDSLSDYDEDEEEEEDEFSCVVCERAFFTAKQLERHQYRKRHWGCRVCEERFPSLVLLEYHKEDEDHWSYDDADDACQHQMSINFQCQTHKRRHRRARCNFESQREIMNELDDEQETEFGASDEDREMLVTSAKG